MTSTIIFWLLIQCSDGWISSYFLGKKFIFSVYCFFSINKKLSSGVPFISVPARLRFFIFLKVFHFLLLFALVTFSAASAAIICQAVASFLLDCHLSASCFARYGPGALCDVVLRNICATPLQHYAHRFPIT